ncbi:MAG: nitronate monooxygenase, partial [Bacteroidales bacterium]
MQNLQIGNLITKFPIIQGGMGVGISLSGLASAVANQGGIGVISAAGLGLLYKKFSRNYAQASIMGLKQELTKARAKTDGIIGVNIMVAMTNYADMVKTAIAEKADIIFSGAGLPLDLPSYLPEGSTTKLVPIVSSARAFKVIANKWKSSYNFLPNAVVVEGPKAGGHLGYKVDQIENTDYSLERILVEVLSEVKLMEAEYGVKIPIIAAGGIYTGEDIYKIMALGASGVQMGTRFVTTDECDASIAFKNTYMN